MTILEKYTKAFARLKRGGTQYGKAPHKPILLLSLIELIDKGLFQNNQVAIDAELVGTFKENWQFLVDTPHQADFTQPFFYLQNEQIAGEGYWFLMPNPGCQINAHIKSVNVLAQTCGYGHFSQELWHLLMDKQNRSWLQQVLLNTYFPNTKQFWLTNKNTGGGYLHDQTVDLLNEPEAQYIHVSKQTEEDVFVRNGLFKRLVPQIYQNRCAFTGMSINSTFNYSFIDACHIIPFSVDHNCSVTNGIALCPNMHRAFDRGLLSIDEDYRIRVSVHVNEDQQHPYAFGSLNGKAIHLPIQAKHQPDANALAWHRRHIFKK